MYIIIISLSFLKYSCSLKINYERDRLLFFNENMDVLENTLLLRA